MKKDKREHFANKIYELYRGSGYHFTANEGLKELQDNKVSYSRELDKRELAKILKLDPRFGRSDEKVRINQRWKHIYWVKEA